MTSYYAVSAKFPKTLFNPRNFDKPFFRECNLYMDGWMDGSLYKHLSIYTYIYIYIHIYPYIQIYIHIMPNRHASWLVVDWKRRMVVQFRTDSNRRGKIIREDTFWELPAIGSFLFRDCFKGDYFDFWWSISWYYFFTHFINSGCVLCDYILLLVMCMDWSTVPCWRYCLRRSSLFSSYT